MLRHILAKQAGTVTVSLSPPYSELQHSIPQCSRGLPCFSASFLDPCQGKGGAVVRVGRAETHLSQSPAGGCLKSSHPRGESVGLQPWGKERGKSQTMSLDVETPGTEKVTMKFKQHTGPAFSKLSVTGSKHGLQMTRAHAQFPRCQMRDSSERHACGILPTTSADVGRQDLRYRNGEVRQAPSCTHPWLSVLDYGCEMTDASSAPVPVVSLP